MDPLIQASAPVGTFTATTDAVAGSLGLSAALGAIPLLTFFVMLLAFKASAYVAGLTSLAVALLVEAPKTSAFAASRLAKPIICQPASFTNVGVPCMSAIPTKSRVSPSRRASCDDRISTRLRSVMSRWVTTAPPVRIGAAE